MGKEKFYRTLSAELDRIDAAKTSKRFEHLIERFTDEENPKAIIGNYQIGRASCRERV